MNDSKLSSRTFLLMAGMLVAVAAIGGIVCFQLGPKNQAAANKDERTTVKEAKGVRFKNPADAKLRGIEAQGVESANWRPKFHVDGRVVPNPHASVELRAPFAGIIRLEDVESKLRLGNEVGPLDTLATFDARFTPSEGLDLKTKLVEAKARHKSAEEVVKIRQERVTRLDKLPTGLLPQDESDSAIVQLSEARMQVNVALTQWKIWKHALESVGKNTIIVPIQSPIAGEIAEIGVQPGANVDAGQLIVRIVDFRRVLIRLDFPSASTSTKPPSPVYVTSLDSDVASRASLRGRAPSIEPGLQKSSWLYELLPNNRGDSPRWQPGLYVRTSLDDASSASLPAVAIPATALLVHQGYTLVYIEKRLGRYERREVEVLGRDRDTVYVTAKGWLVGEDRVVTSGTQVLLSEEFRNEMDDD